MGDPKKPTKTYKRPQKPYDKDRIMAEKKIVSKYGLKNKKELWKSEAKISKLKRLSRDVIASKNKDMEQSILDKVAKIDLLNGEKITLNAVLVLPTNAILERRIQTQVVKMGFANTVKQARQFIVHGHIYVDDIKVTSPSYIIKKGEESKIKFKIKSKLNKSFVKIEKKTVTEKPVKKDYVVAKPEDKKEILSIESEINE
ncbi:MAG: 30S ribosomal protein S4 [DPANN group archaeon]|nr:30S ribosomal protein S4 [DPANN group archaeon]